MATPGALALSPEVDDFRRQFEELADDADAFVSGLSDEQFYWRPAPGTWSVSECLDHLNVTARVYLPILDEGIADAIRRGLYAPGPFTYTWFGRALVQLASPPVRVRMKAAQRLQPPSGRTRHEIMAAFRAYQVQFIDRLRQSSGLDLARARAGIPVASWLRIPLGSAFAMVVAHERRHLWQARQIAANPGFPADRGSGRPGPGDS